MKYKLLILTTLICFSGKGQERHAFAMLFPNYNIENLFEIKTKLEQENFSFDDFNTIYGYFSTSPKLVKECPSYILGMKVQIEGFVDDDGVYIYAIYRYNAKRKTGCSRKYIGQARKVANRKAGCRVAYEELNRIAQIISPELVYIRD